MTDRRQGEASGDTDISVPAFVDVDEVEVSGQDPYQEKIVPRETVRYTLATLFTTLFICTVIAGFISAMFGLHWTETKDLLQLLLPAEMALLGSAVGFYFGTQSREK